HLVARIIEPEQALQPVIVLDDGDQVVQRALDLHLAVASELQLPVVVGRRAAVSAATTPALAAVDQGDHLLAHGAHPRTTLMSMRRDAAQAAACCGVHASLSKASAMSQPFG